MYFASLRIQKLDHLNRPRISCLHTNFGQHLPFVARLVSFGVAVEFSRNGAQVQQDLVDNGNRASGGRTAASGVHQQLQFVVDAATGTDVRAGRREAGGTDTRTRDAARRHRTRRVVVLLSVAE